MQNLMKNFKTSCAALILGLALVQTPVLADNNRPIQVNELPQAAQTLLQKSFGKLTVVSATAERDFLDKNYEVHFNNGGSVEFDSKGNWVEINGGNQPVPAQFIPAAITSHVKQTWNDATIQRIEKDRKYFEIKLSNGIEVTYDANFKVVDVDN